VFGEWSYLAMIAFVVIASWWLEFAFRLRVLRNPLRVIKTIAIVSPAFIVWDAYAISQGHWFFSRELTTGIIGPLGVPLEEYLFFIVVPIASMLTLEGVAVVTNWLKQKIGTGRVAK
jgi:lycopene cyclase domain-containing protein